MQPINIDNLYDKKYFEFKRRSKQQRKVITTIFEGKIKGLRPTGRRRTDSDTTNQVADKYHMSLTFLYSFKSQV